jgi:hypothetical protein
MVAAALILVAGTVMSFFTAANEQRDAEWKYEQATCIARLVAEKRPSKMKSYDQTEIDYGASGCPGWFFNERPETVLAVARAGPPAPLEYAVQPFFIGLFITIVSA